ncbi:MAG: NADH-quinone oxidoreductase subunit NuoK [Planctomycetes bacterium]|nr:NADH-quinone oxidoreductase subunit NuoK [Planctomycetota bacterium]
MVEYTYYLLIGAVLFVLGLIGFITRRNLIMVFLCTELMLHGVILNLVGFNRMWLIKNGSATASYDGQAFAIFLMVVAAAEAALAVALVMVLQKRRNTLDANVFSEMKG